MRVVHAVINCGQLGKEKKVCEFTCLTAMAISVDLFHEEIARLTRVHLGETKMPVKLGGGEGGG